MRWSRFLAPLALIPCFAAALSAQGTGQITGVVTDRLQGGPLNNATVTVLGSSASASTGADGRYTLTVRAGHHQSHPGRGHQSLGHPLVAVGLSALGHGHRPVARGGRVAPGLPPGGHTWTGRSWTRRPGRRRRWT